MPEGFCRKPFGSVFGFPKKGEGLLRFASKSVLKWVLSGFRIVSLIRSRANVSTALERSGLGLLPSPQWIVIGG